MLVKRNVDIDRVRFNQLVEGQSALDRDAAYRIATP